MTPDPAENENADHQPDADLERANTGRMSGRQKPEAKRRAELERERLDFIAQRAYLLALRERFDRDMEALAVGIARADAEIAELERRDA